MAVLSAVTAIACVVPTRAPVSAIEGLPSTIDGHAIEWDERPATDWADEPLVRDLATEQWQIESGRLGFARLSFGSGDGLTLFAVRVPEVDARRMLDLRIRWGSMVSWQRTEMTLGGKAVTVVASSDSAVVTYLYARDDRLIEITTSRPALAERILSALP
jgi:hypothetical protein